MNLDYLHERCTEDGDCWIWNLATSSGGTPKFTIKGKQVAARRTVAELIGKNIEGKLVTNTCGNKRCICPDHIKITDKAGLATMAAKRTGYAQQITRRKKISDKKRQTGKITLEQALEVRYSPMTLLDVANKVGISKSTAQRIRSGDTWKDYANPFAALGAR